ncbi:hypothetical protein M441DRAFT_457075 [Trichoderma asperellum CBS 433.97]|uniref:Uncharacterized protein n=1 Tax=Trichoderma asperellum (strain ATCC 204424 / CBS 433.97 / NBRC 101777) TaxID=1042311 RepID=A0A2T3Z8Y4_TRIA4|nr:hypothetical protein M441DRAFT_457075 [Trichoderma asperellum CBS 433.97]PTB41256.1 hypothetical protein M441DRAFT_457075 [Trichoderma asperellum CBS 433.97]
MTSNLFARAGGFLSGPLVIRTVAVSEPSAISALASTTPCPCPAEDAPPSASGHRPSAYHHHPRTDKHAAVCEQSATKQAKRNKSVSPVFAPYSHMHIPIEGCIYCISVHIRSNQPF